MSRTGLLSLHVAQYLTPVPIPSLISFDKLQESVCLPLPSSPNLSLLHVHRHTNTASTHGHCAFLPFEETPWAGSNKETNPNTCIAKALGDSQTGLLFCLHSKFLKTTMKLDLHPRSSVKTPGGYPVLSKANGS